MSRCAREGGEALEQDEVDVTKDKALCAGNRGGMDGQKDRMFIFFSVYLWAVEWLGCVSVLFPTALLIIIAHRSSNKGWLLYILP